MQIGNRFRKYRLSTLVRVLLLMITGWAAANTSLKKDYNSGILEADAKGYFAYLPAVFIYHDLNFRFFYHIEREVYSNPQYYYQYLRVHNNLTINKYYCGTAICLAPFFVAGHLVTLLTHYPADGYSFFYTLFAHIGALFWLWIGMFFLWKLLRTYQFNEPVIAITVVSVVLGTNLFYYVITEFAMSHLYSFALITWFCFAVRLYFLEAKRSAIYIVAILLGLIFLVRPVNIIVVFAIPFLSGSYEGFKQGLRKTISEKWPLILSIVLLTAVASMQSVIYYLQTGDAFVYSYEGEYFNFLQPHISDFLFSYKKGLFVYTPLLLLGLGGFYYIFKQSGMWTLTLAAFLILIIFVFSSWHMWYYGGSFGQRVMIDFYALFAILLASVLQSAKPVVKKAAFVLAFAFVLLCQFQTYQYRHMIIHWSDMDRTSYWNVFLKL